MEKKMNTKQIKDFLGNHRGTVLFLVAELLILSAILISLVVTKQPAPKQVTRKHAYLVYVPQPSDTVTDTLPAHIDTLKVIKTFYKKLAYHDTIVKTNNVTVALTDTVYNNRIISRMVDYKIDNPAAPRPPEQGIGVVGIFGKQYLATLAAYKYKNMRIYGGWDFYNKAPTVGIGFNLIEW